jgi:hypothetical protein
MPIVAAVPAIIGAAGAIGGSAIAAHGASKAADAQVAGANHAADLQHQDAQAALAFQKQEYADQQRNQAPFLHAGQGAIGTLYSDLQSGKYGDFTGTFQAPTAVTEQNDPGYQFRLSEGLKALQQSAAASGGLLNGGTGKSLIQYGQNFGSNEYQNVYNRAKDQFDTKYNIFKQNQTDRFNRYASIAGVGQTAAGQLGTTGANAANNIANTYLTSGAQIGQQYNNAAAARASGYVGTGNIYGSAFSNVAASLASLFHPASTSSNNFQGYPVDYDSLSF